MRRYLVLFAREPAREAREKGFASPEAAVLFANFALGWLRAAHSARATLVVACPPEDRIAWRRALPETDDVLWTSQRGSSFGSRLEGTARRVARFAGHAVLVGGDVAPSVESLAGAFEALELGADAVLAPAHDGGVSLIGLHLPDVDLLRGIARRRRDVYVSLRRNLAERGRRVAVVGRVADVDGRRDLRALLRSDRLLPDLASLARRALRFLLHGVRGATRCCPALFLRELPVLRGPPLPA